MALICYSVGGEHVEKLSLCSLSGDIFLLTRMSVFLTGPLRRLSLLDGLGRYRALSRTGKIVTLDHWHTFMQMLATEAFGL